MELENQLLAMSDPAYREFHRRLIPNVPAEQIIGIRVPTLRKLAGALCGTEEAERFLGSLPHQYYEENNLHAFLLEKIRNYAACVEALNTFLPFVDNWATCDSMTPPVLGQHLPELLKEIRRWLDSGQTYTVSFAIRMLMRWYLEDAFSPAFPAMVAAACGKSYYINMMVAWYFATALAKQYDAAVIYLEEKRLPPWVHNRTIRKAVESNRIPPEKKAYLRTLRQKQASF